MKKHPKKLKHLGDITVDSGQIVIVDPCYVLNGKNQAADEKLYQDTVAVTLSQKYGEVIYAGRYGKGVAK